MLRILIDNTDNKNIITVGDLIVIWMVLLKIGPN